jgi:hypothetical protein
MFPVFRRSDWIRTSGLCVPNAALYQTEPRFDLPVDCSGKSRFMARQHLSLYKTLIAKSTSNIEKEPGGDRRSLLKKSQKSGSVTKKPEPLSRNYFSSIIRTM